MLLLNVDWKRERYKDLVVQQREQYSPSPV